MVAHGGSTKLLHRGFSKELKQRGRRRQRERQKKQWARIGKTTTLHVHHAFCTFLGRYCTTTTWKCLISRFVEGMNTRELLFFSFPELQYNLLEFNSRKICQNLTNWTRWNWRNKVWSRVSSLFKWRFRNPRRLCSLSSLLYRMETGEKETESARRTMGRWKGRRETSAFSLFPLSPARFIHFDYSIANFIGIPSESLCRGAGFSRWLQYYRLNPRRVRLKHSWIS